jgi:hypothetical protein
LLESYSDKDSNNGKEKREIDQWNNKEARNIPTQIYLSGLWQRNKGNSTKKANSFEKGVLEQLYLHAKISNKSRHRSYVFDN